MFPDKRVMLASYEAEFAASWGRRARDLVDEYGDLYGIQVRPDARASNQWELQGFDGGMTTAGVGGPFTGKGADLMIIDDPVKNSEEARSPTMRAKAWDWWQSTANTRLHPGAVVIVLMTRWHREDLGGLLLEQNDEDGEPFTEVRLPALAEKDDRVGRAEGEALWPERMPLDFLERRRKGVGSYWWAAMFQGRPAPEGGGMFKREWFPVIDHLPGEAEKIRYVRFWDLAATEAETGTDPDYTVGAKLGRHPNGTYVLADIQRLRATPHEVEKRITLMAEIDGKDMPIHIELAAGGDSKSNVSFYQRLVLPGYTVRGSHTGNKSKIVRADPVSARAEAGQISILRAPWNRAFFEEAEDFPNGTHDDQIDAVSGAFAALNQSGPAWTHNALPAGNGGSVMVAGMRMTGPDVGRYVDEKPARV